MAKHETRAVRESKFDELRKFYSKHPNAAFSLLIDITEAQDKTLRHLIAWSQPTIGDHGVQHLMRMLEGEA